ncbi:MAG: LpqB family beta-propeller domain-containing protein, partial [Acidobacteriota bacterium]
MRRGLLTLLVFAVASRAAAQRPSADWRTIATQHFRIHYPVGFEPWASHVAGSIESIFAGVTDLVGYAPSRPVEVIVCDPDADANGLAVPYLDRPEIVLWTSPPGTEAGLGDYSDWAALLTTHELAHIVHLSRPRNGSLGVLARLSPAPFGPVALGSPRWVAEGYATLAEGALTGSGRPSSGFRAMVLRQLAIEGKLPSYADLSRRGGWLGGSMAYLAGSAYLEWLAQRGGNESLRNLWKRMASRRGGGFAAAFRGIFGESPHDLYDRFKAEVTARSLAEEKRLREGGLREGELWQRLRGGTSSPQVSPDGSRLIVRRDPSPGDSFLAVWEIAETDAERKASDARRRRDEKLTAEPGEIADTPEVPLPRAPRWTLPRADGFSAANPRWMPDGRSVLFSRRAPDGEGVLHWDLSLWDLARGNVRRITRGRDVLEADPSPDGRFAVGVRGGFGVSALVRVDLSTGAVAELPAPIASGDAWPVWSHPRISPDGQRIAALLHREGRWRLVTLPAEGGAVADLGFRGDPVSPPAWSSDAKQIFVTAEAAGIWNFFAVDASDGRAQQRTRVTGGAFSPAPTPDGEALFFLELTAKGVNLRLLPTSAPAVSEVAENADAGAYPVLPPPRSEPARNPAAAPFAAPRPYGSFETQTLRPLVN